MKKLDLLWKILNLIVTRPLGVSLIRNSIVPVVSEEEAHAITLQLLNAEAVSSNFFSESGSVHPLQVIESEFSDPLVDQFIKVLVVAVQHGISCCQRSCCLA